MVRLQVFSGRFLCQGNALSGQPAGMIQPMPHGEDTQAVQEKNREQRQSLPARKRPGLPAPQPAIMNRVKRKGTPFFASERLRERKMDLNAFIRHYRPPE